LLRTGYGHALLEFRILGPLEVVDNDGPLRLGGPKQRAVLAILLLNANRVVSVDRIADDLYGEEMPATALTQIHAQISHLRKLLDPERPAGESGSLVETRSPGYVIRLPPDRLDLRRFERLTSEAADAAGRDDHQAAATAYRAALDLWRGPALDDLAAESFAQPAIARLEDLRLAAVEDRIESELALGFSGRLVGELEMLVGEHPLRERLHGQLMRALYGSERQAEALDVYRRLRRTLIDELGIDPGPALQRLERAMLTQDPMLDPNPRPAPDAAPNRSILAVASSDARLEGLVALASPLAAHSGRELIVVRQVAEENELAQATRILNASRRELGMVARVAAFVSADRASDALRLVTAYDVELVLVAASFEQLDGDTLPPDLSALIERCPADVAVVTGSSLATEPVQRVCVPFGGSEHDWGALELAAWLAASTGGSLTLVGTRRVREGRRDASRLLADASLAVQRLVDVDTEPLLVEQSEHALVEAVGGASSVVMGISPRWRSEGIGATRRALLRADVPLVVAHCGLRPGGLAPVESRTRFTWTVEG
jgi:DNA-binding SARP family transcriptional activator